MQRDARGLFQFDERQHDNLSQAIITLADASQATPELQHAAREACSRALLAIDDARRAVAEQVPVKDFTL